MIDDSSPPRGRKRPPKPLDSPALKALALAYVARFSTSAAKLRRYLLRKVRERGWDGEGEPEISALVETCAALGYIDDEAFARTKSSGLLRRGYGPRRVRQALGEAGIADELREKVRPDILASREAILALARRRRFGPFAAEPLDRTLREKQIAAMLRSGHALDSARAIVDATSIAAAERWVAEGADEREF